jgi:hypothetical protein
MTSTRGGEEMMRRAASKVMWVGRATVFVVGLSVIMALVLGMATAAFGANGDFFKVGKSNFASAVSVLDKSGAGPALRLLVDSGAPLAVNSSAKVTNLNADKLDGLDASQLGGLSGVTQVSQDGVLDSADFETTIATCPDGTVAIGGGGRILGVRSAAAIDESRRDFGDPRKWVVGAHETVLTGDVWKLEAFAICATARP